jgi:tetratricopeptide (TPR) repeat protein
MGGGDEDGDIGRLGTDAADPQLQLPFVETAEAPDPAPAADAARAVASFIPSPAETEALELRHRIHRRVRALLALICSSGFLALGPLTRWLVAGGVSWPVALLAVSAGLGASLWLLVWRERHDREAAVLERAGWEVLESGRPQVARHLFDGGLALLARAPHPTYTVEVGLLQGRAAVAWEEACVDDVLEAVGAHLALPENTTRRARAARIWSLRLAGLAHMARGAPDEAERAFREGIAVMAELPEDETDIDARIDLYASLAGCLEAQERHDEMEAILAEASLCAAELAGEESLVHACALVRQAEGCLVEGRTAAALPLLRQACAILEALPDEADGEPSPRRLSAAIEARQTMAFALAEEGRYREAILMQRACIGLIESHHGDDSALLAPRLGFLGDLHSAIEEHVGAEQAYRHALALDPVPAPMRARLLVDLGRLRGAAGNADEAERLHADAEDLLTGGAGATTAVDAAAGRAVACAALDRPAEAVFHALRALTLARSLPEADPMRVAWPTSVVAWIHQASGSLERAEHYYRIAVRLHAEHLPPTHPRLIELRLDHAEVLEGLGRLREAREERLRASEAGGEPPPDGAA